MSDLIALGASGIRAYQTALEVVGDNITNANTPGYSRRSAKISEGPAPGLGYPLSTGYASGHGVNVTGVRRAYDQFLSNDARTAGGDFARLDTRQRWLTELQTSLGMGSGSVGDGLTRFFNAAQDVASDPTATAARTSLLSAAETVAQRFRTAAANLSATRDGIRTETSAAVTRVNEITRALASINKSLLHTKAESSQSGTLRDQRDGLLDELGSMMNLGVTEAIDGSVEVRMGDPNGPILVSGANAKLLGTQVSGGTMQLTIDPFGGNVAVLPGGGALAGLAEAEAKANDAIARLDTLAVDFITGVNAQHALGTDLDGTAGGALFGAVQLTAARSPTNNGSASLALSVTGAIDPQGYTLWYAGGTGDWTLARADGTGTPVSGTGVLTLDGVRVELAGAPRDGDHYSITGGVSASGMAVAITDPAEIAASSNGEPGDNANMLTLISLRLPGNGAYEQSFEKQVSAIASTLSDTKSLAAASKSLRDNTIATRDAGSGVNLDEEAADLLRFQQAYQACSKVIGVAQTLFATILEIR